MLSPALGPAQKPTRRIMLMKGLHYIGLEVHKKTISYVIKAYAGQLVGRGQVAASRLALTRGAQQLMDVCSVRAQRPHSPTLSALVAITTSRFPQEAQDLCIDP